jgi:hypothetical protein
MNIATATRAPISGLKKEALSLYRAVLRRIRMHGEGQEEGASSQKEMKIYARTQYEANRSISKFNVLRIEHCLRQGRKQLELLSQSSIKGLRVRTAE